MVLERNEDARVIGYGDLRIVDDIEKGIPPLEIIASHSIMDLFHLMGKDGAQIIILGCTYSRGSKRKSVLLLTFSVPILEPSFNMLEEAINMMSV